MASRKLERIGIDPSTCEKLARRNIVTIRDLLTTPAAVILPQVDIDLAELNRIVALASAIASGKPQSGLEILHARTRREQFLGCGVEALNRAMKGGLLVGTISEICGSPGAGKTQFCLNCVLQAIVPSLRNGASSTGEGASVIYIDTELKFDPKRLVQMAATHFPELYSGEVREDAVHQVDALLDRVRVSTAVCLVSECLLPIFLTLTLSLSHSNSL
jgi:RecA/RadA recombinase